MSTPQYVRRFDRVTRALNELALHAGGLSIAVLAERVSTDAATLRAELRAYFRADVDPAFSPNAIRQTTIRFHDEDGVDVEPAEAEFVSTSPRPTEEVGADYVTVGELARIYRAGHDLLAVEPANAALESALQALTATVLAGLGTARSTWLAGLAASIGEALRSPRRVELTYARAWQPGVRTHVVEPYRLVKTRRGWELDAGFVEDDAFGGRVGSFLLSGVRDAVVLPSTFERPADADARIAANRRTTMVDLVAPQSSRWVIERFAESIEVLGEDEDMIRLRAHLLPPVEQRLGLLLLVAGPDTWVNTPTPLRDAGTTLARDLLDHYTG
ncbi:WYL domain-containing protein [Jiangella alkaliphila]|uniref:Proteasome accessory factor C n=1 Tax=Jiangella alkaliphila TaxID=419479 RepID=A0A1H2HTV8_9ACTN|nr:WYL domain-containing protein [Jiangella alkaliphila]SDU35234.1 proteasome accessory factor C [Jiangella alkaliphila]